MGRRGAVMVVVALVAALVVVGAPPVGRPPAAGAATNGRLPGVNFYPRVVRLAHAGAANGTVIATTNDGVVGRVWRSTDLGASFSLLSTIAPGPDAIGLCCIALFELPTALGSFPAGTLLWAGSVTTAIGPPRRMDLRVFRSLDHGATWSPLSTCATSTTGGLWEPDFHVSNDGRLVCLYSDESDQPRHSQILTQALSTDGGQTWGPATPVVVEPVAGRRPGMPTVAQLPDRTWVMTYEMCVVFPQCGIRLRHSADGVDWGPLDDPGERVLDESGGYLAHTPVIMWTPAGGGAGTLVLSGQLLFDAQHHVAPGNGRTLLVNRAGGTGRWTPIEAPVAVTGPTDNFCPNYSSPVIDLDGNGHLLELASSWLGDECITSYGTAQQDLTPPTPTTTTSTTSSTTSTTTSTTAAPGTLPAAGAPRPASPAQPVVARPGLTG